MERAEMGSEMLKVMEPGKSLTKAQLALFNDNLKFAMKIAHEYKGMGLSYEEILQEANIGLLEATKNYKKNKGVKFISFAVHYIRMRIRNALTFHNNVIRQPSSHTGKLRKLNKLIGADEDITLSQLSEATTLKEKSIKRVMANKINGFISMNQEASGKNSEKQSNSSESRSMENIMDLPTNHLAPDAEVEQRDLYESLTNMLNILSPIEKNVIVERFYNDRTLESIGNDISRTPAGVKAIIDRGIGKLKEVMV